MNEQEKAKIAALRLQGQGYLLKEGPHDFIAFYHKRKLVLRASFEKFLRRNPEIKEALKRGEARQGKKR